MPVCCSRLGLAELGSRPQKLRHGWVWSLLNVLSCHIAVFWSLLKLAMVTCSWPVMPQVHKAAFVIYISKALVFRFPKWQPKNSLPLYFVYHKIFCHRISNLFKKTVQALYCLFKRNKICDMIIEPYVVMHTFNLSSQEPEQVLIWIRTQHFLHSNFQACQCYIMGYCIKNSIQHNIHQYS